MAIAAVWGVTFVMVQDAVERLPVTAFLAYRFLPAAILVALPFRRALSALSGPGWRAGAVMGAFLTAGYLFQTLGLQRTTVANTGFITGLFVVLTPVLGGLLLGQRVGPVAWAAATASALGLLLLTGVRSEGSRIGDALVLVAACSFALHILVTGRAVTEHSVGALLAVQLGVCGVVCLTLAGLAGDLRVPRTAVVWNALLVTSLVASALGFFVQTYAQQHAPPARTALILASEPAFAALFAYLLQGERLTGPAWLGAALILGSIVAVEAAPHLRPVRPLPES